MLGARETVAVATLVSVACGVERSGRQPTPPPNETSRATDGRQTIAGLIDEMEVGRCRPYFKKVPVVSGTSSTHVTEVNVGPEDAQTAQKITVETLGDVDAGQRV